MAAPWIVTVCRGLLVCLPPLAVYLFAVANRHRGPRPVVLSAGLDFLTLLAGLGGFLLAGGLLFLTAVQSDARLLGRGNFVQVQAAWGQERLAWAAAVAVYAGGLTAAVGLTVRARSRSVAVYNADRASLETAVGEVLTAAGVPAERFGDRWAADRDLVGVEYATGLNHATITVLTPDPRLAEELLRGLADRLPGVAVARPSVAAGFGSAAVTCAGAAAGALLLVVYYEVLKRG